MLFLYFDGLCEPVNPGGIATYGFVVTRNGNVIHEECGLVGAGYRGDDVSNNVAEYVALIKGLEWIIGNNLADEEITVRGDSQLVVNQLNGKYKVKAERLIPLHARAVELLKKFRSYKIEWIPRKENSRADSLTRKALRKFLEENRDAVEAYGNGWVERVLNGSEE